MQTRYKYIGFTQHGFSDSDNDELDSSWHAACSSDTLRTVCGDALDAFGDFELTTKNVDRGGITCKKCLSVIREIKAIKL